MMHNKTISNFRTDNETTYVNSFLILLARGQTER